MADITTATVTPIQVVEAAVAAEVPTLKTKVIAAIKRNVRYVIGAAIGFAIAKFL